MAEIERFYHVTLKFPQTVRVEAGSLEADLKELSASFRLILAQNLAEYWGCFRLPDAAEIVEEIADRIVDVWLVRQTPEPEDVDD